MTGRPSAICGPPRSPAPDPFGRRSIVLWLVVCRLWAAAPASDWLRGAEVLRAAPSAAAEALEGLGPQLDGAHSRSGPVVGVALDVSTSTVVALPPRRDSGNADVLALLLLSMGSVQWQSQRP